MRTGHRVTGDRQRDHTRGAGWEFLHIAIDDHSRLAFAQLLPDETARSSILFLHAALAFFQKLGIKVQRIYSDNGSCYRAHAMARPSRRWVSSTASPDLTLQRPTARPNASSRPRYASGPLLTPTPTPLNAQIACRSSSTTITGIVLITLSSSALPFPVFACH